MSERNWCQRDVINTQEHRDYEEMIKSTDILSQNQRQQKNIEEKRFLNQRDFIEHKSAWSQFQDSDTWN